MLGGLIELGCKIEEVYLGGCGVCIWDDNEGVDLEVCELAVYVDGVQSGNEVDEDVVDAFRYVCEKSRGDLFIRRVLGQIDGDE